MTSTTTTSDETVASETAEMAGPNAIEAPPIEGTRDVSTSAAAPDAQNPARGARYYQRPPASTAKLVKAEQLELMRRLQEMRDAGDLILQFGPFKGRRSVRWPGTIRSTSASSSPAPNGPRYARQRAAWSKRSMPLTSTVMPRPSFNST
jgi:hypothetical protein